MDTFKKFYLTEKSLVLTDKPSKNDIYLGEVPDDDFEMLNGIKSELLSKSIEDKLIKLMEAKGYQMIYFPAIYPVFKKHFNQESQLKALEDIAGGKYYKVKGFNQIDSIQNISGYYGTQYNIPDKFFKELTNTQPKDKRGAAVGPGELVLGLFSDLKNASQAGDLETQGGRNVEVKVSRGRFKGQRSGRLMSSSRAIITDVVNAVIEAGGIDQSDVAAFNKALTSASISNTFLGAAAPMLLKLYEKGGDKTALNNAIAAFSYDTKYKITADHQKLFKQALEGGDNPKRAFLLAMHLDTYRKEEDLEELLIFFKASGGYNKFVRFDVSKSKGFKDLYNTLSQYKLAVAGWADTTREGAFGITMSI